MRVWNADKAIEGMNKGGRFGGKQVRREVYKHNNEIFEAWRRGENVGIDLGSHAALIEGTRVYKTPFTVECAIKSVCDEETSLGTINADCMDVAEELIKEGFNPAILNLASRWHPCGGYHDGTSAQEESLCQNSTLSESLYARSADYPLDRRFGGIYSPKVTFFRSGKNSGYAMRDNPFSCGVVTVAALSFREANRYNNSELAFRAPDGGFTDEGETIMLDKIRTIYRIALINGHDSIVLGAFGCGVFNLRPDLVAALFKSVMDEPEFEGRFKALPFAILGDERKFAPFYDTFGNWEGTL